MPRRPSEFGLGSPGICYKAWRVTRSARADFDSYRSPRHRGNGVDNLTVAETVAVAEVVDVQAPGFKPSQCVQMRTADVGHVDVISHAGSVWGRVIVAVERYRRPRSRGP